MKDYYFACSREMDFCRIGFANEALSLLLDSDRFKIGIEISGFSIRSKLDNIPPSFIFSDNDNTSIVARLSKTVEVNLDEFDHFTMYFHSKSLSAAKEEGAVLAIERATGVKVVSITSSLFIKSVLFTMHGDDYTIRDILFLDVYLESPISTFSPAYEYGIGDYKQFGLGKIDIVLGENSSNYGSSCS